MIENLAERLALAAHRRRQAGLPSEHTSAYRLVSGAGDDLPGLYIEALGEVAFVRLRETRWMRSEVVPALAKGLRDIGFNALYLCCDEPEKNRPRQATESEAELNAAAEALGMQAPQDRFVITEQGRQFSVSVRDGFSWGLFTDMRTIRADLAERWRDRKVLNLFAYTCGFGVYLARQNHTINVDVSGKYLDIGAENYRLNGLEAAPNSFIRNDAFNELARAHRQGRSYDAIVLDPPAFSRGKARRSRRFSIRDDLPELVRNAVSVLTPDGELFVSTNLEALSAERFSATIVQAAREVSSEWRLLQSWQPQVDFPSTGPYHLKTALLGRKPG